MKSLRDRLVLGPIDLLFKVVQEADRPTVRSIWIPCIGYV